MLKYLFFGLMNYNLLLLQSDHGHYGFLVNAHCDTYDPCVVFTDAILVNLARIQELFCMTNSYQYFLVCTKKYRYFSVRTKKYL